MRDVNKNRREMAGIQSDLSSGRSVRVPSQDPVSFQSSRIIEGNLKKTEQYQSNINSGLRQGRLAQDTMNGVIDSLIQVKDIMVKGASDTVGESERESMADEISGIRRRIVDSLNSQYGDRYLFAGTNSGDKPFELAGGVVTNNSNNKAPHIVAADGVEIDISITGQEIANTDAGDLFDIIGNVEDALRNNDDEALNDLLPDGDETIEHVTNLTSKLGDNINRMDFMFEQYESTKITQESDVSELVDTNYAEAFSKLQRNQVAYESAIAAHSKMFKNVLLNYI
ncbi:flagellar hook-associated protein 3 [Fodinibius salicampi]